jgi:hypothetical protein
MRTYCLLSKLLYSVVCDCIAFPVLCSLPFMHCVILLPVRHSEHTPHSVLFSALCMYVLRHLLLHWAKSNTYLLHTHTHTHTPQTHIHFHTFTPNLMHNTHAHALSCTSRITHPSFYIHTHSLIYHTHAHTHTHTGAGTGGPGSSSSPPTTAHKERTSSLNVRTTVDVNSHYFNLFIYCISFLLVLDFVLHFVIFRYIVRYVGDIKALRELCVFVVGF